MESIIIICVSLLLKCLNDCITTSFLEELSFNLKYLKDDPSSSYSAEIPGYIPSNRDLVKTFDMIKTMKKYGMGTYIYIVCMGKKKCDYCIYKCVKPCYTNDSPRETLYFALLFIFSHRVPISKFLGF